MKVNKDQFHQEVVLSTIQVCIQYLTPLFFNELPQKVGINVNDCVCALSISLIHNNLHYLLEYV